MSQRAFTLVAASAMQTLRAQKAAAVQQWADDWLGEGTCAPELQVGPLDAGGRVDGEPGYLVGAASSHFVWMAARDVDTLAGGLIKGLRPVTLMTSDDLVAHLCRAALTPLLEALLDAPAAAGSEALQPCALPSWCLQRGAAVVEMRISWGGHAFAVVRAGRLPGPLRSVPRQAVACEPLMDALSQQVVEVQADLGHIALDVGALYRLRKGDVIRLSARLDAPVPLQVLGHAGLPPVKGYLGAVDRHRALEIVAEN